MDTVRKKHRDSFQITLREGTRALLRPVTPGDRERLRDGLALLSREARYLRFFGPVTELTEEQLRYFTEVDQYDHVAWGAMSPDDLSFPGYGIGRFVRLEEDPSIAEAAVTVLDAHQRKGLGTVLIALLYLLACDTGVQTLRGAILPENRFLIDWLRNLGAATHYQDGVMQVDIPVFGDLSRLSQTPSAQRFRRVLEEVGEALYG